MKCGVNYPEAAAARKALTLNLKLLKISNEEIRKGEKYVLRDRTAVNLTPQEENVKEKSDRTVVYRIQAVVTNKIEDIGVCLGPVMRIATFIIRGRKYGTVEV